MPGPLSRHVDLLFSSEGDFSLGENGDVADTENDHMRSLIQRIITRLSSAPGDWNLAPGVGVGLSAIIGQPNTRANGLRVEEIVASGLVQGGLLASDEFSVVAFPADQHTVGVILKINPRFVRGQTTLTFTYDLRDNRLIPRTV